MRLVLFLFCSYLFGQNIVYFQNITNKRFGDTLLLSANGEHEVLFAENYPSTPLSLWKLTPDQANGYRISTAQYGDWQVLTGDFENVGLVISGNVGNQIWVLEPIDGTYFKIKNLGYDRYLDCNGANQLFLDDNKNTNSQAWKFQLSDLLVESFPTVAQPGFISPDNFSVEAPWTLTCRIPNPNTDGNDTLGDEDYHYQMFIQEEGTEDVLFDEVISSTTWPVKVQVPVDVPEYTISISRVGNLNKHQVSPPTVIRGPSTFSKPNPSTHYGFDRFLLHIPKQSGGYDAKMELRNTSPEDQIFYLTFFDQDGQVLVAFSAIIYDSIDVVLPVYGENGLIQDSGLVDKVSHIGFYGTGGFVHINLLTTSLQSGFGVWSDTVELDKGQNSGAVLEMAGSVPDDSYFAGIAVLNLNGLNSLGLSARQIDPSTFQVLETISLGEIGPGQKKLFVLSSMFSTFVPNSRYEIVNETNDVPLQSFGLAGKKNGDFLAEARITPIPRHLAHSKSAKKDGHTPPVLVPLNLSPQ